MDLQEMYNTAISIIENLRTAGGSYSVSEDSSVCVLVTFSGHVYSGLMGTSLENGVIKETCPEYNAVVSMMTAGETQIAKMMTVMFRNGEVVSPCEECKNLIFRINRENSKCEIAVSKSGTIALEVLMPDSSVPKSSDIPDNNSVSDSEISPVQQDEIPENDISDLSDFDYSFGFDSSEGNVFKSPEKFEVETAGSINADSESKDKLSVDYVSNITIDEDNPFYEPPIKNESNIVRDGNIEFEMYNPNKPVKIPKPKALNDIPVKSSDSGNNNNSQSFQNSYNSDGQYNPSPRYVNPIYANSVSEQYQSPYKHSNSGTSTSSYSGSQTLSGNTGDSIYKQKLNNILNNSSAQPSVPLQPPVQESVPSSSSQPPHKEKLSKFEMLKYAREKKRLAKIDAKFQKKIKKKGY